MADYTVVAALVAVGVVGLEVRWLRTGLFRRPEYAITMVVVLAFQVAVDGWLTKLSAPIVRYDSHRFGGLRFPWDIPLEDFLFGFALVTLTLLLWLRSAQEVT